MYIYFSFCGQVQGEPVCESHASILLLFFYLLLYNTQLHRPIHRQNAPHTLSYTPLARNRDVAAVAAAAAAAALTHMCWSTSNINKERKTKKKKKHAENSLFFSQYLLFFPFVFLVVFFFVDCVAFAGHIFAIFLYSADSSTVQRNTHYFRKCYNNNEDGRTRMSWNQYGMDGRE